MAAQAVRAGASANAASARLMRETNRALSHMTQVITAQTAQTIEERRRIYDELVDSAKRTDQAMINRKLGLHDFPQNPSAWLETLISTTMETLGCSRAEALEFVRATCLKEPRHESTRSASAPERNGSARRGGTEE